MTAFQDCVEKYWKYYRALENRFLETERYVEFDLNYNGKAYSMEYMMLFQAICSEIDVVGKEYAKFCNSSFKPDKNTGINEWWFYISLKKPSICEGKCTFRGKKTFSPWVKFYVIRNPEKNGKRFVLDKIGKSITPLWWNAYNGVKHNRSGDNGENYRKASLQNVLNALAALYVLETNMLTDQFNKKKDRTFGLNMESKVFDEYQKFYTCYLSADPDDL